MALVGPFLSFINPSGNMWTLGDKSHLDFKSSQVDMKMNSLPHRDDLALHSTGPALGLTFPVCVGVVGVITKQMR